MPMTRAMLKKFKITAIEEFIDYLIDITDFDDFPSTPGYTGSYDPKWKRKEYRKALRNKLLKEKNDCLYSDDNIYMIEEYFYNNGMFHFGIKDVDDNYVNGYLTVTDGEQEYNISTGTLEDSD